MKTQRLLTVGAVFGLLAMMVALPVRQGDAQGNTSQDFVPPHISHPVSWV